MPPCDGSLYAIDLETIGLDASLPDSTLFGIGLANDNGCWYVDIRQAGVDVLEYLQQWLRGVKLVAFNTKFDGAFLQKFCGRWLDWEGCAYGLFKQLSNEGFIDQEWNLEWAQLNVLGWDRTNKDPLDVALAAAGVDKGSIHLLDPHFVGEYCASDADAAWQLWQVCNAACAELGAPGEMLLNYHQKYFMTEVRLLVEQQFRGMQVDEDILSAHHADLFSRIAAALNGFLTHPTVAPHIEAYYQEVHAAWKAAEPPQFNKNGTVAVRWEKWAAKESRLRELQPFNINSKPTMGRLFYEQIFRVVRQNKRTVVVEVDGKQYEVEKTDGGALSVKKQILPLFGEPGRLLFQYNKLVKEEGYVRAAVALRAQRPTLHPDFNSTGTVTGRLAGGTSDD